MQSLEYDLDQNFENDESLSSFIFQEQPFPDGVGIAFMCPTWARQHFETSRLLKLPLTSPSLRLSGTIGDHESIDQSFANRPRQDDQSG